MAKEQEKTGKEKVIVNKNQKIKENKQDSQYKISNQKNILEHLGILILNSMKRSSTHSIITKSTPNL